LPTTSFPYVGGGVDSDKEEEGEGLLPLAPPSDEPLFAAGVPLLPPLLPLLLLLLLEKSKGLGFLADEEEEEEEEE